MRIPMLVGKLQRSLCEKGATNQRCHAAGVFGIFFFSFPSFFLLSFSSTVSRPLGGAVFSQKNAI